MPRCRRCTTPGVVQIFEYGMHEHCEFLAMEYFPCGDLKQRLQQPITPEQSIEYVRRIAMALQPVHAAGLMHRDLKPPNVMLRADCSVVLIDFGLAKQQNAHTASTELGIRRGSPYYMSPEQVQGMPLDSRSDLYSLGVIFYEMLTGRKPYTGATALELMDRHVCGDRPGPAGRAGALRTAAADDDGHRARGPRGECRRAARDCCVTTSRITSTWKSWIPPMPVDTVNMEVLRAELEAARVERDLLQAVMRLDAVRTSRFRTRVMAIADGVPPMLRLHTREQEAFRVKLERLGDTLRELSKLLRELPQHRARRHAG